MGNFMQNILKKNFFEKFNSDSSFTKKEWVIHHFPKKSDFESPVTSKPTRAQLWYVFTGVFYIVLQHMWELDLRCHAPEREGQKTPKKRVFLHLRPRNLTKKIFFAFFSEEDIILSLLS